MPDYPFGMKAPGNQQIKVSPLAFVKLLACKTTKNGISPMPVFVLFPSGANNVR